ncbi:hypothetical protein EZ313_19655 [Ramlibacter henchirensis]|uniref:Uncharacterized protein n=1 Tax=Ramlibacter henchirensis TaxID=204072 RepID=A0A4Z0BRQ4_9BURK|nr:hypothetical protein [Ramlibacter henchirensis]TFZ00669.1 hypothetical protein EZ313_19655 [Ramlibacter henchirensis]
MQNPLKSSRLLFVSSVFYFAVGLVVLLLRDDFTVMVYGEPHRSALFLSVGLFALAVGVGGMLLLYLRGGIEFRREDFQDTGPGFLPTDTLGRRLRELRLRVDRLDENVSQIGKAQVAGQLGDKDQLVASLLPAINAELAKELENRYSAAAVRAKGLQEVRETLQRAHRRLENELDSLSRRGNLNLVIGVLTTALAVTLLAYMVLGHEKQFSSVTDLLSHYVPRVTIVVFVEVFSFFFLRLYRTTLAEIRTYQADLTEISVKQVAVEAVWNSTDDVTRRTLSRELLNAPRHTVGQQVATDDLDPKALAELLVKFSQLLPKKGKDD